MRRSLTIAAKSVLALISLGVFGVFALEAYLVLYAKYAIGLPDVAQIASTTGPVCQNDKPDAYVPLSAIPPLLQKAIIASDEADFYERPFVNPYLELGLAAISDRKPRLSNITWAVTKCLMGRAPGCCRPLDGHIGGAFLVGQVAWNFSRHRLLEIYLNEMYLGRGSYGVRAAAMAYFDKPMGLLTIDEIALIAALHRAPQMIGRRNDLARSRRDYVIDRMLQAAVISEPEAIQARQRPIEFRDAPSAIPAGQRSP